MTPEVVQKLHEVARRSIKLASDYKTRNEQLLAVAPTAADVTSTVQALIDARIIDPAVKAAAEANLANHKSTLETMRNLIGLFVEQATNSNGMNPGQPIKTAAAKGQGSAHDLDADVFESEHLAESWAKLAAQAAQYPV